MTPKNCLPENAQNPEVTAEDGDATKGLVNATVQLADGSTYEIRFPVSATTQELLFAILSELDLRHKQPRHADWELGLVCDRRMRRLHWNERPGEQIEKATGAYLVLTPVFAAYEGSV